MNRRSSNTHSRVAGRSVSDMRGAVIPLFAICILMFVAIAGLALDAGLLYRARLRLQRSADAGVVSALGYRATKGWMHFNRTAFDPANQAGTLPSLVPLLNTPGQRDAEVVERAKQTIAENLLSMGMQLYPAHASGAKFGFGDPLSPMVTYSSITDEVTAQIEYDVPLFIMSYLPGQLGCGTNHSCRVSVIARGQLAPANVGLVLDTSGSMRCPRNDPGGNNCSCLKTGTCPTPAEKLEDLVDAVFSFVTFFNPNRDRINIVPFNTVADPNYFSIADSNNTPETFGADAARFATFINSISTLSALANTNPCEGFALSLADMQKVTTPPIVPGEEMFFVFFTDGAPTAATYELTDRVAGNTLVTSGASNRWVHYAIDWQTSGNTTYTGPSPFVHRDALDRNFSAGAPPAGAVVCGNMESDPAQFDNVFGGCVNSLEFRIPGLTASRTVGSNVPFSDYRQQYYHCLIEVSDIARNLRGTVFSVGLGPQALSTSADPYQNVFDDFSRKEYLLRRIAYDRYYGDGSPEFGPDGTSRAQITINDPADPRNGAQIPVGYADYQSYSQLAANAEMQEREGSYYGTEDSQQLHFLFSRVAKSILLRLTL